MCLSVTHSPGEYFGRELTAFPYTVYRGAQHCSLAIPHLKCFFRELHQTLNQRISFFSLCTLAYVESSVHVGTKSSVCSAGSARHAREGTSSPVQESKGRQSCCNNLDQRKVNGIAMDVLNSN